MKTLFLTLLLSSLAFASTMPFSLSSAGTNAGGMHFSLGTPVVSNSSSMKMGAMPVLHSIDILAPGNYAVTFDIATITESETGTTTITITGAEVGSTYSYTITSSRGGSAVTGSGTVGSSSWQITLDDLSGLMDGTLSISVTLEDVSGNEGSSVTHTATLDAVEEGIQLTAVDSESSEALTNNTATFNVVLKSVPTDDVTITLISVDASEGVVTTPASKELTFTMADWDQSQEVVVTGVDDDLLDGDTTFGIDLDATSSDSQYQGKSAHKVLVNADNENGFNPSIIMYLLD